MSLLKEFGGEVVDTAKDPKVQEWLKGRQSDYNIHKNFGFEGLLGKYIMDRYMPKGSRFNFDFEKGRIGYRPTDRFGLYVEPDSLEGNVPKGIRVGANFNF